MKRIRLLSGIAALAFWAMGPTLASACERCFGAGSDAASVAAVSTSMFALLMMTVVVFSGLLSFVRKVAGNEMALDDGQCRPSAPPSHEHSSENTSS